MGLLVLAILIFLLNLPGQNLSNFPSDNAAFAAASTIYRSEVNLGRPYLWEEYRPDNLAKSSSYSKNDVIKASSIQASATIGQKVFVSMATISSRISASKGPLRTVRDIYSGAVVPDHIYLFVSRDKYMIDEGISESDIPKGFNKYIQSDLLTIVFTNNTGPHRKLLPLLQKLWHDDVVIITFDDDKLKIKSTAILRLLNYYVNFNREAIVGLRVRRIGLCSNTNNYNKANNNDISNQKKLKFSDYGSCSWPRVQNSMKEMLVLPTGSGGVLYRPQFFNEIVFDENLYYLTKYNDDLTFRLATLINKVYVVNGCCESPGPCNVPHVTIKDRAKDIDLFEDFNITSSASRHSVTKLWDSNESMNSKMWLAANLYLKQLKLLKSDSLIQSYVYSDRPECFSHSDIDLMKIATPDEDVNNNFLDYSYRCNKCHLCDMKALQNYMKFRLSNKTIAQKDNCGIYSCNSEESSRYNWYS